MLMYLGSTMETGPTDAVFSKPLHPYTQFLLSAVLDTDVDSTSHRMLLQGEIPSPIDAPAGCRFCTRCPYASDEYRAIAPPRCARWSQPPGSLPSGSAGEMPRLSMSTLWRLPC